MPAPSPSIATGSLLGFGVRDINVPARPLNGLTAPRSVPAYASKSETCRDLQGFRYTVRPGGQQKRVARQTGCWYLLARGDGCFGEACECGPNHLGVVMDTIAVCPSYDLWV